ncbi:MAG TPA: helix-turn-helix transcriptional regulator [Pseudonocardiaceae bacterium]
MLPENTDGFVVGEAADGIEAIRQICADPNLATLPSAGCTTSPTGEREVTVFAADGMANEDIARKLAISAATAKTHVYRAMLKLGARDRAQLVVFAY